MRPSGKLGQAVMCLFALPFATGGLFVIVQAIRTANTAPGKTPFWFLLAFGLVFAGVGFGLMFAALWGGKLAQRKERLQVEHPTEPWLWREDWAQGRANSTSRSIMVAGWIFTIFWNAISMPVAWMVVPAAVKQKGAMAYLGLLFPMVGVVLLIYSIRRTIAFFEFGNTYFEMTTRPGVIGGELKGQIQARFPHSPDHGVRLRLSSVHRITNGSGNSQSTTEKILWRDEAELSAGQLCPGATGTLIPVDFRIPLEAQPTETRNSHDAFVWWLEALADVPGVDYHDVFEVPVFRTQQTPVMKEADRFSAPTPASGATRPKVATIEVRQNAEGTEFYFPAARNKNFAVSATMFMFLFSGVTFFLMRHAPMFFALVFGFFAALLFVMTGQLWFGTSKVVIESAAVRVQSGWFGGGKVRRIARAEIRSIGARITSQQGGATGIPYYDIELTLGDGKRVTLGRSVRDKHEADWLVQEMRRLAGLQIKSMVAGTA